MPNKQKDLWAVIPRAPLYEVSESGEVRNCKSLKDISVHVGLRRKYPYVCLWTSSGKRSFSVHRLVAEAFIPNPDGLPVVRHSDGSTHDYSVGNLKWGTHADNEADKREHGTLALGERNHQHRLSEEQVREVLDRVSAGESKASISRYFHVHRTTISLIALGKKWKHVQR